MPTRTLTFDITTNDAQTLAKLRGLQRELERTGDVSVSSARKTAGAQDLVRNAITGVAAVAVGRYAIDEAEEAQRVESQTAAVIRSTGNAAQVTAAQQGEMVDQLSKLAAVDDEVVAGGANILRTFKSIQGTDIFGDALASSLDLSAALGSDLQSAALQVGKALEDPVAGITALRRAGVSFTAQQREQIKAMVEVGDKAGAQKLILKELETQFGGQAEAAATDTAKMKVAFGNAAESAGQVLAPALGLVAKGTEAIGSAFSGMSSPMQTAVLGLGAVAVVGKKVEDRFEGADLSIKGLDGSLSKLDKTLIGATAGLAAFGTTTELLENASKFSGDLNDLSTDLTDYAKGTIDANEATQELGDGIDSLARSFAIAFDKSGYLDRAGSVIGFLEPGAIDAGDIRRAENDIKALDSALASMVESGNAKEAELAYGGLAQQLIDMGIPIEDIARFLPEYNQAQDRAARSTKNHADAAKDAVPALEDLTRVSDAQIDSAIDLNNKQRDLADAQQATKDAVDDLAVAEQEAAGNSDEYRQAREAITDAQRDARDAADDVRRAQLALNDAYRDAAEALQDKQFAAEGAALSEERAQLRLEDAREKLANLGKDGRKVTDRERREAILDVKDAELALREAQDRRTDSAQELADAERAGVEGSPQVVAAKEAVTQALDRQRDAEGRVSEASRDAADIISEAKDRVKAASDKVDDSLRNEAELHRNVAEKVYGTAAANEVYISVLKKHSDSLTPGSPLRTALDSYIRDLERLASIDDRANPASAQPNGGRTGTIGSTVGLDGPSTRTARPRTGGDSGGVTVIAPNLTSLTPSRREAVTAGRAADRAAGRRIAVRTKVPAA